MEIDNSIQHASFGTITASRVSGYSGFMYGSDLTTDTFVELVISQNSILEYDKVLGRRARPTYHRKDEVVAVKMTAAQFSEFITTLNISQGTPCTIERKSGEPVEQFNEEVQSRIDYEYEKLKRELQGHRSKFEDAKRELSNIISGLPQYKQEKILRVVDGLANAVCANTPFYMEQLTEVVEEITATAKTEIANYIGVVQNMRPTLDNDKQHFLSLK